MSVPILSAISLSIRTLTKSALAMRAGEAWIVLAKIAPPQGCVMPISSCITFVVVATFTPPTGPYTGSARR